MPKKKMFSRSRVQRLLVERLERRSMLAADIEANPEEAVFTDAFFEDAFFDWSQFDESASFEPWTADAGDLGLPSDADLSWFSGEAPQEPWPLEPEPLPESGDDDPAAATTGDAGEFTDAEIVGPAIDDTPAEEDGVDTVPAVDDDVENVTTAEPVADFPVPVETETPTLEPPLSTEDLPGESGEWIVESENDAVVDEVGEDAVDPADPVDTAYDDGETVPDVPVLDPEDPLAAESDEGDVTDETASLDEAELQAEESLVEDSTSSLPDLPIQPAATSGGSAAPRAAFSPRSTAFAAMRMLGGFGFSSQADTADEGPIFAGGRRRVRR